MILLRDDQVPAPPVTESYQEVHWSGLIVGSTLMVAVLAGAFYAAGEGLFHSWFATIIFALLMLVVFLIARLALRGFLASRRPTNWRVRWGGGTLYLRYRSFWNEGFDPDSETVLALKESEVAWVRAREEVLQRPNEKGNWTQSRKHRWMEIALRDADFTTLRPALAVERERRTAKGSRVNDEPLTITRDQTLRLQLTKPETLVDRLRLRFKILLPESEEAKPFEAMSQEEKEDHVLALAAAGDRMAAVKAAREVYGMDLREAKNFVESLGEGGSADNE